ncbi:hypothetical protein [Methanococcoides methylutens]|uniref:hypothetical protein n=1 Tax=Methanococcoides methylutens TaxID=2226 RepID=UPI0013631E72|nr:hypothetical protein [Methanococcoides methylutens]
MDLVPGVSCALVDAIDLSVGFMRLTYDLEIVFGNVKEKMPNSKELVAILKRDFL